MQNTSAAARLPSRRILLVDDNEEAAQLLAKLLRITGHDVVVSATGADALHQVDAFRPQFILLDLGLPGMDGGEIARQVRGRPDCSEIKIIAISGYRPESIDQNLAVMFDAYLVKPVGMGLLAKTMALIDV